MNDDEKEARDSYLTLYIQKQEALLLDYLRKTLDLDIKVIALTNTLKDWEDKYDASQNQVKLQNDMMDQAAKGIEVVTIEKKQLEEKVTELNNRITEILNGHEVRVQELKASYDNRINDLETNLGKAREELNKTKQDDAGCQKQLEDMKREFQQQKNELNILYNENVELKSKLPPEKVVKKPAKRILDDNEF